MKNMPSYLELISTISTEEIVSTISELAHCQGRWIGEPVDNIFVERLWRSVKYEEMYIKDYQSVPEAASNLRDYFVFYNYDRLHQALDYETPAKVYIGHR